jgi:predicted esterase
MARATPRLILVLIACLTASACDRGPAVSVSTPAGPLVCISSGPKPSPPLMLEKPAAPPVLLDGQDLRKLPDDQLRRLAHLAETTMNYPNAAILQYWLVERTKTGRYDLACYLARTGKADPAFYWLQLAALEEGVDADHAARDEDLATLRADPRWHEVQTYLTACTRYFESGAGPTALVLPAGYKQGTPIPVVVWLHGLGSNPEDFVNERCQVYADAVNVAIVGVSATVPRGPRKYVWAVDAERDARRVKDALAEVSNRVTIKPGHLIAFGFSQGGQVALELAVRNPEEFAGAIVLSPGAASHLADVQPSPRLTRRGFVLTCGEMEAPGNVELTTQDADWLRAARAKVLEKHYAGVSAHALPADFATRFPEWIKLIEQTRGE